MASDNQRYQGKPLLRLLECYVLWSLGELPEGDAAKLTAMAPKLRSVYGVDGEWHHIIASAVNLAPDTPARIRDLWARNTEIARKSGATLTPQAFAEMFVDRNVPT
jgi:hypothetical protein